MADNTTQLAAELRETAQKIEVGEYDWARDASLLRQAAYVVDNFHPDLDAVDKEMINGAKMRREADGVILFSPTSGETIAKGKSLRDLLVELAPLAQKVKP